MPEIIEDKQQDIDLLSGEFHLVGVYGSLKHGESNHRLLSGSKIVGVSTTLNNFELLDLGSFPGMVKGNQKVVIEVYKVNNYTLQCLDRLEGHPSFYKREQIPIFVNDSPMDVWVYILQSNEGAPYTQTNEHGVLEWSRRVI